MRFGCYWTHRRQCIVCLCHPHKHVMFIRDIAPGRSVHYVPYIGQTDRRTKQLLFNLVSAHTAWDNSSFIHQGHIEGFPSIHPWFHLTASITTSPLPTHSALVSNAVIPELAGRELSA